MKHSAKIQWLPLAAFLAVTQLAGLLSSLLAGPIRQVYEAIEKPPLSPPGGVFGIVWPILYALMAVAAYRIFRLHSQAGKDALFWFWVQLALNVCWTPVFFRLRLFWAASVILAVLDLAVLVLLRRFSRLDKWAGRLLVPYLLWLLFATYLNVGVALLN